MKICNGVSWINVDDGIYLINCTTNKCIVLDNTGERIWNVLLETDTVNDAIAVLQNAYIRSEHEKIKKDVFELLDLLISQNFIDNECND